MTKLTHKQYTVLFAVLCGNDTPSEVTNAAELLHCRNCVDTLITHGLLTYMDTGTHKLLELTHRGFAIAISSFDEKAAEIEE